MLEILSWLPVKSLLQFRCVCKSWKSLISDPKFVKLHLHRSARNPNLLLLWERKHHELLVPCSVRSLLGNPSSSSTIDEDDCYPLNDYEVIGSCNGLVCLVDEDYPNPLPEHRFCLYNPATKLASKDFACLRVGDSSYDYQFAFGYDNLSDTYKVLAFIVKRTAKEESQKIKVKICSLGDNCWRKLHSFPVNPFYIFNHSYNKGVYFNGTFNWLASCNINSNVIAQLVIVSLDVGTETCTQLLLPREALPINPTIGVLMDCLCFFHSNGTHFVVWQMKEFGVEKSWTQFIKVSYPDLLQIDCLGFPLIPLCTSENGDVLIITNIAGMEAILYHRSDNRVERTKLLRCFHWYCTMGYVESLVSPSSVADLQP